MNQRDTTKYYHYHRNISHTTYDFWTLNDEVEGLIQWGQLQEYVWGANRQPQQQAPQDQENRRDGQDIKVRVIIGGSVTGDAK